MRQKSIFIQQIEEYKATYEHKRKKNPALVPWEFFIHHCQTQSAENKANNNYPTNPFLIAFHALKDLNIIK